jgi:redox-sensitive bicupin YhaK (pirin superfamily)
MSTKPQLRPGRAAEIAPGASVVRLLPTTGQRMTGPFCFVDVFGPMPVRAGEAGIGPHPHVALHTVTWLLEGRQLHTDSHGSRQMLVPGELNVMTAGSGIVHAEDPQVEPGALSSSFGVQMWVAQPDATRNGSRGFRHQKDLPELQADGLTARVFLGTVRVGAETATSPVVLDVEATGAELRATAGTYALSLDAAHEHALLLLRGAARVDGVALDSHSLCDLGAGRDRAILEVDDEATLMLIGGAPFGDAPLLWWNFAGRADADVREARDRYQRREGFGDLSIFGERPLLDAPNIVGTLRAKKA